LDRVFYYVDKEKCIGCGACLIVARGLFEPDGKGKVINTKRTVEGEEIKMVLEAARVCPTDAIVVEYVK